MNRVKMDEVKQGTRHIVWLETVGLTVLAIILPYLLQEDDPLSLASGMYWPFFAPLLLALRYGFLPGFFSMFSLVAFSYWAVTRGVVVYAGEWPMERYIGFALAVMAAGEFSDIWRQKQKQTIELAHAARQQLAQFTDNYYILQISLHEMEKTLAGYSMSLSEALDAVRQLISTSDLSSSLSVDNKIAEELLHVFVEYGHMQSAALIGYSASSDAGSDAQVIASVGELDQIDLQDALLEEAEQSLQVISIQEVMTHGSSSYQACVPISDNEGNLYAMVVVESFQFFAFKENNLSLLAVVASFLGETFRKLQANNYLEQAEPRSLQTIREGQLIEFIVEKETVHTKSLFSQLRKHASFESISNENGILSLSIFLPITELRGPDNLIENADRWCFSQFGKHLEALGVEVSISTRAYDALKKF